ncbi:hypothetical protein [Atlantibacter hermannii]|uniref:hypothetical protein n=1 Tax=Atlantibacter hermannii TaxID=565 RepID=UPI00289F93A7|nr:hypothetical protein [Atlantibacter hermannii]
MLIDIPGTIDDYFFANETEEIKYKPNRSRIRALVDIRNQKIQQIILAGGNPHTASLDLQDQINDFFSDAPVEAQVVLYETMTEELLASASALNDEADKINAKNASSEAAGNVLGQILGALILVVFLIFIFAILK